MAPLDAVGTDVVGSVRALNRSRSVGASPAIGGSDGSSPLDDFLHQHPKAMRGEVRAPPPPRFVEDDEPRFGRITFSAGVGGVLIELQAQRPIDGGAASVSETHHAIASYALAQRMSDAVVAQVALERQERTANAERGSFWGQPVTAYRLPMMV